ncbi:hypothetical protein ACF0H5_021275 [Mactra antiquata]
MMTIDSDVIPIPDDPVDCTEENDRRLWIGNLDTRVTEFALLKILQKFGSLQRYDFLYNQTGPEQGKPRGYCFVSYTTKQEAEKAMKALDRKLALSKRMMVRWAHKQTDREGDSLSSQKISSDQNDACPSAESKIKAIEMKLKSMEKTSDDFSLSTKPLVPPGSSKYSVSQNQGTSHRSNKPYHRKDARR